MADRSVIDDIDAQLREHRKALTLCSRKARVAVWDQIDRLLERRQKETRKRRKKV
jgi:hypothetical protein